MWGQAGCDGVWGQAGCRSCVEAGRVAWFEMQQQHVSITRAKGNADPGCWSAATIHPKPEGS